MNKIINSMNNFVETKQIKSNTKVRKLVAYKKIQKNDLLKLHKKLLKKIESVPFSPFSYAYRKKCSTKDAFEFHLSSNLFIKLDIKNFFESITYDNFTKHTSKYIKKRYIEKLQCCFYENTLPLGFVTSPKLSDIYLLDFDFFIIDYLKDHDALRYSRYCDDILISTVDLDMNSLLEFKDVIVTKLLEYNLEINEKKVREFDLSKQKREEETNKRGYTYNPSLKYLGLNLVRKDSETLVITVPKRFIVHTVEIYKKMEKVKTEINELNDKIQEKYNKFKPNRYSLFLKDKPVYDKEELIQFEKKKRYFYLLHSVFSSRLGYIEHNSKESYNKLLHKLKNIIEGE